MIVEHAQAILDLLDADNAAPPLVWFNGQNADPVTGRTVPPPYVLVYFDSNDPESTKEAQPYRFEMTATCHCVGGSALASQMVADRVRTALLMVAPAVSGRSCFPITRDSGVPPQRDESTGSTVMDQVDVYVLRSLPG